ncbi:hypothetical protein M404DRAFT_282077 [Pisolithus tinctorius Marx 270]|uniref:Uncharacterized protein n=1 Tax=Pisolithus tinctorius Marx 270 TaxID=870435 RepID=A0A0C3PLS3_PISTI|nr:hypothetical protein M404DRAFT_282077 [Pisolithus tinctorius Marx 270]
MKRLHRTRPECPCRLDTLDTGTRRRTRCWLVGYEEAIKDDGGVSREPGPFLNNEGSTNMIGRTCIASSNAFHEVDYTVT